MDRNENDMVIESIQLVKDVQKFNLKLIGENERLNKVAVAAKEYAYADEDQWTPRTKLRQAIEEWELSK